MYLTGADLFLGLHYRRDQVQLSGTGPWMQPRPPSWLTTVLSLGLANALRREIQICPECLHVTPLGATRCHCGFCAGVWR